MPIPDTQDMPDNARNRNTSYVVQTHSEPGHRLAMLFGEVMPHDGLELRDELGIFFR